MTTIEKLQKLLEAERSRVICLEQIAFLSPTKEINRLFSSMRNDASVACEALHSMILDRGGYTTTEVSELAEKIMELDSMDAILDYLIRDEKDVIRQIEEIPPEELKQQEMEYVKSLWHQHTRAVENCGRLLRGGR